MIHPDQLKRDFKKRIERIDTSRHLHQLFADWTHIAACTAHQMPYHSGLIPLDDDFHTVEADYMAAIKSYTRDQLNGFAELFAITLQALSIQKSDFLGQVYHELELANQHRGQFFTPYNLSLLIAKMTLTNISDIIERQGYITVHEPACGAGGMIIAAAQAVEEAGYDPTRHLFFVAQDISDTAYHMTFIQASACALRALVRRGDTLANTFTESRFTSACRLYPSLTNAALTAISSDPVATPTRDQSIATSLPPPPQLTLFPDLTLPPNSKTSRIKPVPTPIDAPTTAKLIQSSLF